MNLSGRRRKRLSDQSLSCESIRSIGSSVTALEVNDIFIMGNKEFLLCADQFGKYYGYPSELFNALKAKTMFLLNQTNMLPINDDIIVKLGYIASYFDSAEMESWIISKMNTIAALRDLNLTKSQV